MENNITLSICIPTYNRRDLVCENVLKILMYEGEDMEVIVNDNASEDGTVEALRGIGDKRLRIYQNETNIGANGNYMRVLMYAIGRYVMLLNDRDYVEHKDIQEFVREYKEHKCDIVMCINEKNLFNKNMGQMAGRTFLLLCYDHPGYVIMGRKIHERLKRNKIETYNDEQSDDVSYRRLALCIYSKRWRCYNKVIIRQPESEELGQIVQLRGKSDVESIYFTPAARLYRFGKLIENPYIYKEDMEAYISAIYRVNIYFSLIVFYRVRNDSYLRERYNYEPDASVCWIMTAIKFCKESISILKKKDMCTSRLVIKLGLITMKEYIKLCRTIAITMKKKFFPKPWLQA